MLRIFAPVLLLVAACAAQEPELVRSPVPDGINDKFLDPQLQADEWTSRWEVESREIYTERAALVRATGLAAGEIVADIGAGTGLFVGPFAAAVGETGHVYALDISPGFIAHLNERVAGEDLGNVTPILSGEASTDLPDGSVDVVFVCDTYHHFEYHEAMLASIRATLRPGGRLVVVDFERIPGVTREWVMGHVRAGKDVVTREILAAGFELRDEVDVPGIVENYVLRFERP